MKYVQMHGKCGDGAYCGSFNECKDCANNLCPIGLDFGVCACIELDTVIYYASFYQYSDLDYKVCVPDAID